MIGYMPFFIVMEPHIYTHTTHLNTHHHIIYVYSFMCGLFALRSLFIYSTYMIFSLTFTIALVPIYVLLPRPPPPPPPRFMWIHNCSRLHPKRIHAAYNSLLLLFSLFAQRFFFISTFDACIGYTYIHICYRNARIKTQSYFAVYIAYTHTMRDGVGQCLMWEYIFLKPNPSRYKT